MKPQHRLGLAMSWPRVTVVFLIAVAVLYGAGQLPDPRQPIAWWAGVGVAGFVSLAGLVTYRGVTVPAALAGWVWDWSGDPEETLTAACTPAIDHRRRYGHEVVGIREFGRQLVSVIAVDQPDSTPASRHQRQDTASASLPVSTVAAGLRQFDTRLDGIDIISVSVRGAAPETDVARSTWLVLRMDPHRNSDAVASRDSVASTMAAATERLAHDLAGRQCTAWPMGGDEIAEVDSVILAGLQPTWGRPGWLRLKHYNGYATSFWVSPRYLTSKTLEELWLREADATVVTVRISTGHGGPKVSAWVRYHSDEPLPKSVWSGLNRFTGRQLPAVRAGLPAPETRPFAVPARRLAGDDELSVPLGPITHPAIETTAASS
ncbi:type VII secretion protein EccE [Mycobacterium sp. M1]|uniref:Type VII secretion protein EccE n=1 Tax=Mycolicibacter acidiphilus TaxID=2835306 RepID=A0ABS5RGU6_9MYCO|nr:type VII secretion protein EccE [Mycolicibacter acidiphilus]MBS9533520.1 type VII secretion protein EccE [Mycolicibacter acidiphilus]